MTRSKDVKANGVSEATENSEAGTKVGRSEKTLKKRKLTMIGGNKGRGTEEGSTQQVSVEGGTQGGDVDVGGGTGKNQEGGSKVEGIVGSGCVTEGGKGVGVEGVLDKGDSGVAPSGECTWRGWSDCQRGE